MTHPYKELPDKSFWKTGVSSLDPDEISDVWLPKFPFDKEHKVATAGSCFAQHFSRSLTKWGYTWFDAEPAPQSFDNADLNKAFNYGVFSFRTGNIYTAGLLRQWVFWALGLETPPDEYWVIGERIYDPFRPVVEPEGFASVKEMRESRRATFRAIRKVVMNADRFVFTLGLTEAWVSREHGAIYPMCPGVAGGDFDAEKHELQNFNFNRVRSDLVDVINAMQERNKNIRILLTVSPVPLTATATPEHALIANTYTKSLLRTVAGDLTIDMPIVDYFPGYEMITSPVYAGRHYENNKRNVRQEGVDYVMSAFYNCLNAKYGSEPVSQNTQQLSVAPAPEEPDDDLVCEEILIDAARLS